ncbi:MAG: histidine phosphatase family protein [Pseudomonadota bacterium]
MTDQVIILTHGDVEIDPKVDVPQWPLNARGRDRHSVFAKNLVLSNVTSLFCSAEQKAIDGAEITGSELGLTPIVIEGLGENDRSATGFLPKEEFEKTADAFFAYAENCVRGWETAVAAQTRIVAAVESVLATDRPDGDVLIVSHGAVAGLLRCALKDIRITREEDQPAGQGGNWYSFPATMDAAPSPWRTI